MVKIVKTEEGYNIQRVLSDNSIENISRNTFTYNDIVELVRYVIITFGVDNDRKYKIFEDKLDLLVSEVCDYCNIFEYLFYDVDIQDNGDFIYSLATDYDKEESEYFSDEDILNIKNIVLNSVASVLLDITNIIEYKDDIEY